MRLPAAHSPLPTKGFPSLLLFLILVMTFLQLQVQVHAQETHSFYFMGNSYSRYNGFTNTFQELYKAAIGNNVETLVQSHLPNAKRLLDHYVHLRDNPPTQPFDWMILQDQSLVPAHLGARLGSATAAESIQQIAYENGVGAIMFLMTWGRERGWESPSDGLYFDNFLEHNEAIAEGYLYYVERTTMDSGRQTYVAPVGLVFETLYRKCQDAQINPLSNDCPFSQMYQGDGSHPSDRGSYVMALTVVTAMTGGDPLYLPSLGVPEDVATTLKTAVRDTIVDTLESGLIRYPFQDLEQQQVVQPAPTPPPTLPPTLPPTPQPTTLVPTMVPTSTPTTNMLFLGMDIDQGYLMMVEDIFYTVMPLSSNLSMTIYPSPLSEVDVSTLQLDRVNYDWIVLLPDIALLSAPGNPSLNTTLDLIQNLYQQQPGTTQILMEIPFAGKNGYTSEDGTIVYSDFVSHTDMLWEACQEIIDAATALTQRPTYLAPVGLVYQTINSTPSNAELFEDLYNGTTTETTTNVLKTSLEGTYVRAVTLLVSMQGLDIYTTNGIIPPSPELWQAVNETIEATRTSGSVVYPDWLTEVDDEATSGSTATVSISLFKSGSPTSKVKTNKPESASDTNSKETTTTGYREDEDGDEAIASSSPSARVFQLWECFGSACHGQASLAFMTMLPLIVFLAT